MRHPKQKVKRKVGCRCGNATATPGKLTCCGQRCPCYVEAKSCVDCRCRGCRNPHTPGGKKLRPFQDQAERCGSSVGESSNASAASATTVGDLNLPAYVHVHGTSSTSRYSNSPLSVEQVPTTLLVDDEKSNSDNSDVDVDVWAAHSSLIAIAKRASISSPLRATSSSQIEANTIESIEIQRAGHFTCENVCGMRLWNWRSQ